MTATAAERLAEPQVAAVVIDGRRFQIVDTSASWAEARDLCRAFGGRLAVLDTPAKLQGVAKLLGEGEVWIGLSDLGEEGTWIWVNGEPAGPLPWGSDQPDNFQGREHCAGLRVTDGAFFLNDLSPGYRYRFVCEAPAAEDAAMPTQPLVIADSKWDFSGEQGRNGWYYGWYDLATGDHPNRPETLRLITFFDLHDAEGYAGRPGRWTGQDQAGEFAWNRLTADWQHPSGTREQTNGKSHSWVVRRWISDWSGSVRMDLDVVAVPGAGSAADGVVFRIFRNGEEVVDGLLPASPESGRLWHHFLRLNILPGESFDFVVDPKGNNWGDGTHVRVLVIQEPDGSTGGADATDGRELLADSADEFAGQQAHRHWRYGYYDTRAGEDPKRTETFQPFEVFDEAQKAWRRFAAGSFLPTRIAARTQVPFVQVGVSKAQEWPVRRWTSPVTGSLLVELTAAAERPGSGGGDGVVIRLFSKGQEITGSGLPWTLTAPAQAQTRWIPVDVKIGDHIDFAVDPRENSRWDAAEVHFRIWGEATQPVMTAFTYDDGPAELSATQPATQPAATQPTTAPAEPSATQPAPDAE